jgi:hypothetical protein
MTTNRDFAGALLGREERIRPLPGEQIDAQPVSECYRPFLVGVDSSRANRHDRSWKP